MINILVIDDHKMFVQGLESILEKEDDITIVGKYFNTRDAFIKNRFEEANLILLDIDLPDSNGIDIAKIILHRHPHIKIIMLTMHDEQSYVTDVSKCGASGYVLKNTGREELLTAIRTVMKGYDYYSPEVLDVLQNSTLSKTKKNNSGNDIPKITRREQEVLELIVRECTNTEIAEKLFISLKTVEAHRSSLLSKLNARNTAGLVMQALKYKIVEF